ADISPLHIDILPAIFEGFCQNNPKTTGASKPDTDIAVPVTIRSTNPGIMRDNTKAITDTIKTESLLYNSIFVRLKLLTFGFIISLAIDEAPAIKHESALEMTAANNTIIMITTTRNGNTS